jgi:hypothetical protein
VYDSYTTYNQLLNYYNGYLRIKPAIVFV